MLKMLAPMTAFIGAVMVTLAVQIAPVRADDQGQALDTAQRATVRIIVLYFDADKQIQNVVTGSGFVVAPGDVVTNAHVVSSDSATYRLVYVVPHRAISAKGMLGQVLDTSAVKDLALISVPGLNAPILDLSDTMPGKDSTVHALGYPGVTDELRNLPVDEIIRPSEPYVTQGAIALFSDFAPGGERLQTIFHTAAVNPGNSGGPLIDACGRVIGVNTWMAGATMEGDRIAVPAGQFVASRSSSLIDYLRGRGLTPQVSDAPCVVSAAVDPAVLARLNAAETALANEQQKRAADEAEALTERHRNQALLAVAAAILGVAATGAVGLYFRRKRVLRPVSNEAGLNPEESFSPSAPLEQPGIISTPERGSGLPFLLAGCVIAVLLGCAIFYWLYAGQGGAKPRPPATEAAAPPASRKTLVCQLDTARSRNPAPGTGPLTLTFDRVRACVNDRTAYEQVRDGFARTIVIGGTRTISRTLLRADLSTLRRDDYILRPQAYVRLMSARAGITAPHCPAQGSMSPDTFRAIQALRTTADSFTHGVPDRAMVWLCKVQDVTP